MAYTTLRGRWCDIVLSVPASAEDKSDDKKESFTRNESVYSSNSKSTT